MGSHGPGPHDPATGQLLATAARALRAAAMRFRARGRFRRTPSPSRSAGTSGPANGDGRQPLVRD